MASPLRIERCDVPVSGDGLVTLLWHKGSPWVEDIRRRLQGSCPGSLDRFFVAWDGATPVGHVWYTVAQSDPRLGLLGHVFTRSEYRRRGVSSRLLGEAMAQFGRDGGQVMQLFTDNSVTLELYRRFGFETVARGPSRHGHYWAMRRPAESQWLDSRFSADDCRLRTLADDDLPRYCLLYNVEDGTVLKDRAQGIGLGREAELAFLQAMEVSRQKQGAYCVLDNGQTIVGVASLVTCPFDPQSHVGLLDYYVHPRFAARAGDLIAAAMSHQRALGVEFVHAFCVDEAKRLLFSSLGFHEQCTLAGHYHLGEQRFGGVWLERE